MLANQTQMGFMFLWKPLRCGNETLQLNPTHLLVFSVLSLMYVLTQSYLCIQQLQRNFIISCESCFCLSGKCKSNINRFSLCFSVSTDSWEESLSLYLQNVPLLFIHYLVVSCWCPFGAFCLKKAAFENNVMKAVTANHKCVPWLSFGMTCHLYDFYFLS